jgi:hypothetical protein
MKIEREKYCSADFIEEERKTCVLVYNSEGRHVASAKSLIMI